MDRSAHHFSQLPCNIKAKACAFHISVPGFIQSLEGVEQLVHVFTAYADTGIRDLRDQGVFRLIKTDIQADTAFFGIFDGIAGDVQNDLSYPDFIAVQDGRDIGINVHFIRQPFILCFCHGHIYHVIQHRCKIIVYGNEFHSAGFDLAEIQNVIDDGQECPAGASDVRSVLSNS